MLTLVNKLDQVLFNVLLLIQDRVTIVLLKQVIEEVFSNTCLSQVIILIVRIISILLFLILVLIIFYDCEIDLAFTVI